MATGPASGGKINREVIETAIRENAVSTLSTISKAALKSFSGFDLERIVRTVNRLVPMAPLNERHGHSLRVSLTVAQAQELKTLLLLSSHEPQTLDAAAHAARGIAQLARMGMLRVEDAPEAQLDVLLQPLIERARRKRTGMRGVEAA